MTIAIIAALIPPPPIRKIERRRNNAVSLFLFSGHPAATYRRNSGGIGGIETGRRPA